MRVADWKTAENHLDPDDKQPGQRGTVSSTPSKAIRARMHRKPYRPANPGLTKPGKEPEHGLVDIIRRAVNLEIEDAVQWHPASYN